MSWHMAKPEVGDIYVENAGERYQVATLRLFKEFRDKVCDEEGWKEKFADEKCKVWTKHSDADGPGAGLNIVKVNAFFPNVDCDTVYDALHDPGFRKSWDTNMIEGLEICRLDARNDVGYYAAKFPFPLANRDFLNQRSWMEFENGEYIIMNHSVTHPHCPEKKNFVRGQSIISGYYLRPMKGGGTELLYLTHSDIKGSIPHMVLNSATQRMAPSLMQNLNKNSENYIKWYKENYPPSFVKGWRTPKVSWDEQTEGPSLVREASAGGQESIAGAGAGGEKKLASTSSGAANDEMQKQIDDLRIQLARAQHKGPADMSLAPVAPRNSDDPKAVQQYRALMDSACSFVDRQFLEEGRVPPLEEYLLRLRAILDGMRRTPTTNGGITA